MFLTKMELQIKRAHSAVILDNYKLIKFYDNGQLMLFDLNQDLSEKNDLSINLLDKNLRVRIFVR